MFKLPDVEPVDDLPINFGDHCMAAAVMVDWTYGVDFVAAVECVVAHIDTIIMAAKRSRPVMYPSRRCALSILDRVVADILSEDVACESKDIDTVDEAFQRSLSRAELLKYWLNLEVEHDVADIRHILLSLANLSRMHTGRRIHY